MTDSSSQPVEPGNRHPPLKSSADMRPFKHRILVLTEVVDEPDEITLVTVIFERMGWSVRSTSPSTAQTLSNARTLSKNRTLLIVEVRLNGYAKTAPREAVRRIDELREKAQIGVWVLYARIIEYPPAREKTYYIEELLPRWIRKQRRLSSGLRLIGLPRTVGVARVAPEVSETDLVAELTQCNLVQPFDHSQNYLRAAGHAPAKNNQNSDPSETLALHLRLAAGIGIILSVVSGAAAFWVPGVWKAVVPIFVGVAMARPIGRFWPDQNKPRTELLRGLLISGSCAIAGLLLESNAPNRGPLAFLAVVLIALLFLFIGFGLAFVWGQWVTKNISWMIPLVITLITPLVLWYGGALDAEYLSYGFGMPAGAVSVPSVWRLAIAGEPVLIGLVSALFFIAIIGWLRYFYLFRELTRLLIVLQTVGLAVVYLLSSLGVGISLVNAAARQASADAHAGYNPATYFGLQGTLVCVQPVGSPIPVYDGPLPANQPVLSFGADGDRLWLWDPHSYRAINVSLNAVTVTRATGIPAGCRHGRH